MSSEIVALERTGGTRPTRIAYIMSRFPKISETFVLYEMKALEEMGRHVDVFPLRRGPAGPRHPEAVPFERRANFAPLLSPATLTANVRALVRAPRMYLSSWWEALSGTFGSLKFFLGALGYFPKFVAFAERMRKLDVDHVHAHFANHPALAAFVVHRLTGIPFSFTAHGSDLHVDRRMLGHKVEAAAFVVTVSEYNREIIVREAGEAYRDKTVVIHCGADPAVFATEVTALPASPRVADLRIACVASLDEVKGHRFLLEACRYLVDRGVRIRCDLAGDGPLRSDIERRVASLGLGDTVHLHGALARPAVRSLLAASDVAVLASHPTRRGRREGIPVALMEAMMAGLPVVASALSGIPELVEDGSTGFLVQPGDSNALADRLERLAAAPALRCRLGEAGRRKVMSEFDLRVGARLLLGRIERARARRDSATIDATRRHAQLHSRNTIRASTNVAATMEVDLE